MQLQIYTEELMNYLEQLKKQYEHNSPPTNLRDKEFFHRVREETTPIYDLLEAWESEALKLVQARIISTIHPQQISSTRENYELLLMHSYYKDVRRKRYMELYQSIIYIFDAINNQG